MIELRTLGALSLTRDDGREVRSVLAQPKRVALLAYLASPDTPAFTARETLLGLFWPELDEARARSALRTSLHFLRRSLDSETMVSRGEHEVGVSPEHLWCDVGAFEEKLTAGAADAALALYGGDYLPGLMLDEAPGFERWLEAERRRLRRRAHEAARGLAGAAASRGEHRDAEGWARRALALDPWDEEALRLLMELLAREGNRAEALRAYELFGASLKTELELDPSPETQALATRLRDGDEPGERSGAEAAPELRDGAVTADGQQATPGDVAGPGGKQAAADGAVDGTPSGLPSDRLGGGFPDAGRRRAPRPTRWKLRGFNRRMIALGGAGLVLLTCGLLVVALMGHRRSPGREGAMSDLAILPFSVVDVDSTLGTEVAQMVALNLRDVPGLILAPPSFTFRWWRAEQSSARVKDPLKLPVGDALRVRFYMAGTVLSERDSLEARVTVFGAGGTPLPAIVVRAAHDDEIGLGDAVALEVLRLVHPELARSYGGSFLPTSSVQAVEEFLRGEDDFNRDAWRSAERHYLAALRFDSTFALAWWRLDNVGRWLSRQQPYEGMDLRRVLREQGAQLGTLDSLLMAAQLTSLADGRIDRYRDVVRRFPHDAYAALLYGNELLHRGPLVGLSEEEALDVLADAAARDTFQAPAYDHLAWLAIRLGKRDVARRALGRLHRIAGPQAEMVVDFGELLGIAYQVRFAAAPDSVAVSSAHLPPAQLGYAARTGDWTGLPGIQLALGAALDRSTEPQRRADGHEARALALLAMGGGRRAVAQADSAAALYRTRVAQIEAAEWRVVPAALGWPLAPATEVQRGRRRLSRLARDPELGGRAAWALALDALARGDSVGFERWRASLAQRTDSAAMRLRRLLQAAEQGYADAAPAALRLSEPLLRYDESARGGDPFARATLHLLRGEWHRSLGDGEGAERDWLWAENMDVIRWPMEGEAQAADVDWVFSVPAAFLRANLAITRADTAGACQAEAWVGRFWGRDRGWPRDSLEQLRRVMGTACGV